MLILAATGHRPPKLGGYGDDVYDKLVQLATGFMIETKPDRVISGMALGWDQAWAQAAVDLRIPFIAAIPCHGQSSKWPSKSVHKWKKLMALADRMVCISEHYTRSCMQDRNVWMVDNCDEVVALWDGSSGGTGNCIRYAMQMNRPIHNLYEDYIGE